MIYVQTFIVTGRGEFPTDMLRYDHCWRLLRQDGADYLFVSDFGGEPGYNLE